MPNNFELLSYQICSLLQPVCLFQLAHQSPLCFSHSRGKDTRLLLFEGQWLCIHNYQHDQLPRSRSCAWRHVFQQRTQWFYYHHRFLVPPTQGSLHHQMFQLLPSSWLDLGHLILKKTEKSLMFWVLWLIIFDTDHTQIVWNLFTYAIFIYYLTITLCFSFTISQISWWMGNFSVKNEKVRKKWEKNEKVINLPITRTLMWASALPCLFLSIIL